MSSEAVLQNTFKTYGQSDFLSELLTLCEQEFGKESVVKWLSHLEISLQSESEIIFSVSSKFLRDWIIREFVERKGSKHKKLKDIVHILLPKVKKIAIIFIAKITDEALPNSFCQVTSSEEKIVNLSKYDNVFALGTELNPKFTFQNFISVKYNKLALSMAKIAAGLDAQIDLFDDKIPLFIHGNVGIGKTHLAQAIAWQIKESSKSKKVVYLSAEKFMYHFVRSIRSNDVMGFKEKMRSIDVLIVDDVQFIAGKESTQQEFMNCFNHLVEENKQVVLICDRRPFDLENIDEKLKSRISGGMVINFKNPDYQDRLMILNAKLKLMDRDGSGGLCEKVVSFIAENVSSNVRDLEGALKKLLAEKLFNGVETTMDNVRTILTEYVSKVDQSVITIDKIKKNVAQFYGLKITDLASKNRAISIARPRQIAMYLAKNLTTHSLPKIGEEFGGKNHATVIHAVKVIRSMMDTSQIIFKEVKEIEDKLLSR